MMPAVVQALVHLLGSPSSQAMGSGPWCPSSTVAVDCLHGKSGLVSQAALTAARPRTARAQGSAPHPASQRGCQGCQSMRSNFPQRSSCQDSAVQDALPCAHGPGRSCRAEGLVCERHSGACCCPGRAQLRRPLPPLAGAVHSQDASSLAVRCPEASAVCRNAANYAAAWALCAQGCLAGMLHP